MDIEIIRRVPTDEGHGLLRTSGEELKHAFCHTYSVWLETKSMPLVAYAKIESAWMDYIRARDRWINFRDREI